MGDVLPSTDLKLPFFLLETVVNDVKVISSFDWHTFHQVPAVIPITTQDQQGVLVPLRPGDILAAAGSSNFACMADDEMVKVINILRVPRVTNDGFFASTSCAAVSAWYCFTCKSVNFSVMFDGTVTQSLHHTSHHHTPLALALPYNLSPLQYDKSRVTYTHLCYIPCTMIITVIAANGM